MASSSCPTCSLLFMKLVLCCCMLVSLVAGWKHFPSAMVEQSSFKGLTTAGMSAKQIESRPTVRIVIFDKVIGYLNWYHDDFKQDALEQCSTKCMVTNRRDEVGKADVVIFHAPTHGKMRPVFPGNKGKDVLYGMFSMEQPKYAPILAKVDSLQSKFDFMVTYNMDDSYPGSSGKLPNIPVTYYPLHKLAVDKIMKPARSFEEKNGYNTGVNVAVFVSNCRNAGANVRLQYIEELMKHIKVHSYGGCLHNFDEPKNLPHDPLWPDYDQKRSRKMIVLSHYKFYLAFENFQIHDYVSEKVYEGLISGSVPVYRGASRIAQVMPSNHSYIDANNMTPEELAKLLDKLSNDKVAYEKYLEFRDPKKAQISNEFVDVAFKSYVHPMVACRLCDYHQRHKHGRRLYNETN